MKGAQAVFSIASCCCSISKRCTTLRAEGLALGSWCHMSWTIWRGLRWCVPVRRREGDDRDNARVSRKQGGYGGDSRTASGAGAEQKLGQGGGGRGTNPSSGRVQSWELESKAWRVCLRNPLSLPCLTRKFPVQRLSLGKARFCEEGAISPLPALNSASTPASTKADRYVSLRVSPPRSPCARKGPPSADSPPWFPPCRPGRPCTGGTGPAWCSRPLPCCTRPPSRPSTDNDDDNGASRIRRLKGVG